MTAAEAMLVRQRVFALPSTNALVVPLSRDDTLVGLLVGEMPEGHGEAGRRTGRARKESGRARAKRRAAAGKGAGWRGEGAAGTGVRAGPAGWRARGMTSREAEVLEDEAAAADVEAQFGDRRQAALSAAARSIVAAWVRSDRWCSPRHQTRLLTLVLR